MENQLWREKKRAHLEHKERRQHILFLRLTGKHFFRKGEHSCSSQTMKIKSLLQTQLIAYKACLLYRHIR
ncbi:hypothetical protein CapIbe_008348 [Capra ibex]